MSCLTTKQWAKQFGALKASSFALVIFAMCLRLSGHPISLTTAHLEIESETIQVRLTVMLEDLVLFHQLQPNVEGRYAAEALLGASEVHEGFLLDRLTLLNGEGQRLSGYMTHCDRSSISGPILPEALMERLVTYEFEYPLSAVTQFLTIVQRFAPDDASVPAIMDLTIRSEGKWIHRPAQLVSNQALTVSLESDRSMEPGESQWEALRRQKEAEAQLRLGITSYAGLYSFIYVTESELRHEVLVPLLTLEEWLPLSRAATDLITVAEQDAALARIEEFFRDGSPAWINGVRTVATVDQVQFFGVDMRDFARNAAPKDVSVYQARVGVILSYQTGERPRNVALEWNSFGPSASAVQSTIFVGDAAPQKFRFWKGNCRWEWESDLESDSVVKKSLEPPPLATVLRLPLLSLIALTAILLICFRVSLRPSSSFGRPQRCFLGILLGVAVIVWWPDRFAIFIPRGGGDVGSDLNGLEIGESLISTVYAAFNEGSEEAAYDVLEEVVTGTLLETLYLDFRRALTFRNQGGAVASVKQIDILSFEPLSQRIDKEGRLHALFSGQWRVEGNVEHWGHIHRRRLDYRALVNVYGSREGWRIEALDVIEENQSPVETSVRYSK